MRNIYTIPILVILVILLVGVIIFISLYPGVVPMMPGFSPPEPPSLVVPITNYSELVKEIPKEVIIRNLSLGNDSQRQFVSGSIINNGTQNIAFYSLHIGCFNATGNGVLLVHLSGVNVTPGSEREFNSIVPPIPGHTIESVKLLSVEIYDKIPTVIPSHSKPAP